MKNKKINLKSKSIVIVNLFLIITLMIVSVYAWFASNVNNNVVINEIQVQSDNKLELSFDKDDEDSWSGTLDLANLQNDSGQSVLSTMKFVEVTGDGETFYSPELNQNSNYASVNTEVTNLTEAKVNEQYLQFTVYMRSKDHLKVYLGADSAAKPSSSVLTGDDCGNASGAKLETGAEMFSKDCVVGALRVSYENPSGIRYIWITNPEFHLNNKVGSDVFSMDTNATSAEYSTGSAVDSEDGVFYWNDPYQHYYYSSDKEVNTASNVLTSLGSSTDSLSKNTNRFLVELKANDTGEYYEGSVTFTIWIEGCDTEARQALVGGKFRLSLVLDTITAQ